MIDEHEKHLLSAALGWPEVIPEAAAICRPEDFAHQLLGEAWGAAVEMAQAGEAVHPLALAERVGKPAAAEELRALYGLSITGQQATYHARQVRAAALERQVRLALEEALRDKDRAPEELIAWVQGRLAGLLEQQPDEAHTVRDRIIQTVDNLEEIARRGGLYGVPTGFAGLDDRLGGLPRGSLTTVAARPSVGKSSLCVRVAALAAQQGAVVDIYSLEDTEEHVHCRMIAQQSAVPLDVILRGTGSAEEWQRINAAAGEIYNTAGAVLVEDRLPRSVDRLVAQIFRNALRRKTDLVVVDYFQLLGDPSLPRNRNRSEELASVAGKLKDCAKRLGVALLLAAQLRRDADEGAPQLRHLKDCGALEQDSDLVVMLERPDNLRDTDGPIPAVIGWVRKARNGPTGSLFLRWRPRCVLFSDADEELAARMGRWVGSRAKGGRR